MAKKGSFYSSPESKFHTSAGKPGGMSMRGGSKVKAKGWPTGTYIFVGGLFGLLYFVTWGSPFKK